MKAYIAAPFFNPEQIETVERIKRLLDDLGVAYFSPKDECMFVKGKTKPKDILDMNVDAIRSCTFMIAVTEGKDMGTLFECGYAYAIKQDVIYYWDNDNPELKFNLMLSASGYEVAQNMGELEGAIVRLEMGLSPKEFNGELE